MGKEAKISFGPQKKAFGLSQEGFKNTQLAF